MNVTSKPRHTVERSGQHQAFQRDLSVVPLTLLTVGGIMGSGLFLATGLVVSRASAGALILFLVAAVAMSLQITALAEMAAADPEPGSFLVYAQRVYGPGMSFIGGWVFWFSSVLTMATEVTAAALFTHSWFPGIPLWAWSLVYSVAIVAINFVSVRGFGAIEGAMAGVKVAAVSLFLLLMAAVVAGLLPGRPAHAPALYHLAHPVWWPAGGIGPLSALVLVLFAFAGTGVLGLAAGETKHPAKTISRSLAVTIPLVVILYLGSVAAILVMVPAARVVTHTSPFVQALTLTGIPVVGRIMNLVLIFAVLSTMNAALYSNSRVLYDLGQHRQAPRTVGQLDQRGLPAMAIWWSAGLLALTILLAYLLPKTAYSLLVTATGFQAMFIWLVVLLTQLRYRPYLEKHHPDRLKLKLFLYPWTTYLTIGIVAVGMLGALLAASERVALILAIAFIAAVGIAYLVVRSRGGAARRAV
jgi:L-asparagine transporter-like permease